MHIIRSLPDASRDFRSWLTIALFAVLFPVMTHAQQLPDLTITRIVFVNGVKNGDCNKVTATIRNSQNVGVSGTFQVQLMTGFDPEGGATQTLTVSQVGIGPGASLPVTFTGVRNIPVIIATVDSGNAVRESVENNNSRTYTSSLTSTNVCPVRGSSR